MENGIFDSLEKEDCRVVGQKWRKWRQK